MKKRVNITIEEKMLNTLDKMAEERGVDRSTMISILVYDSAALIDLFGADVDVNAYARYGFAQKI